jgi:hypothetical protein
MAKSSLVMVLTNLPQAFFKALLDQVEASQLLFHFPEKEEAHRVRSGD